MEKTKQSLKKKKIWIPILAPKEFLNKEIGETQVYDMNDAINKRISCNLASLTNDLKKQQIKILLNIKEIKENKCITEILGYEVVSAQIKRLSKSSKRKIDKSLKLKTKDNIPVVIKVAVFIKSKVPKSVLTVIRGKMEEIIINNINNKNYEEVLGDILFFKLQKTLHYELKRVTPIYSLLIRAFRRV